MVRRREDVVDGRDAPPVLGRERTQVEALRRERHLCTNRPVASMAWMTETRRENSIYALNVTSVSSFSRRVSVYEKRFTWSTKMRGHVCKVRDFFDFCGFLHFSQVIFSVKSSTAVNLSKQLSRVQLVDPFWSLAESGLLTLEGVAANGNDRSKYGSYRTDR